MDAVLYLLGVTIALCISYFILIKVYSYFFTGAIVKIPSNAPYTIFLICILSLIGYGITYSIPHEELANRFQHAFGGGFLAFVVCYFAVRDSKLPINKFQFFVFSFMLVTTLGVANEIMEYSLRNYMVFFRNPFDTWYDLISNTTGALIAALSFVPHINKKK